MKGALHSPARAGVALRVAAVFAAAVAAGCVEAGRQATASVDEYAAFRRFRVSPTLEQKLGSGYSYLREHPGGRWRAEVSRWFQPAQAAYVARSWNSRGKLEAFLGAVPSGPTADMAAARLTELRLADEFQNQRDTAFDVRVRQIEGRLASAEAGRRALISGVVGWAGRIAGVRSFGERTSELGSDFIGAFRIAEPVARCTDDRCEKTVVVSYSVPEGKVPSPRDAVYDVVLELENGGVRAAWLTGPDLFMRLGEALRIAAVDPNDFVARIEAVGQATQVIALAVEPLLPASRCGAEAVSPVVLHRVCDGVELRVVSALELGDEDRVVITPAPAAPKVAGAPPPSTAPRSPAK